MDRRAFTDGSGIEWRVRATVPSSRGAGTLPDAYSRGWLVFESDDGVIKRLAPIPEGWESVTDEALELLGRAAVSARDRVEGMTAEVPRYEPGAGRDRGESPE